jgi:hypothetical protein
MLGVPEHPRNLRVFNNDSFPNVKRVFIKFNAPEASSACSERLFSGGKLIFETKRTSLGDAILKNCCHEVLIKTFEYSNFGALIFFLKY